MAGRLWRLVECGGWVKWTECGCEEHTQVQEVGVGVGVVCRGLSHCERGVARERSGEDGDSPCDG